MSYGSKTFAAHESVNPKAVIGTPLFTFPSLQCSVSEFRPASRGRPSPSQAGSGCNLVIFHLVASPVAPALLFAYSLFNVPARLPCVFQCPLSLYSPDPSPAHLSETGASPA